MRKVVITGMGCINSIAENLKEFSEALKNACCGVKEISLFDTTGYRTSKAAQVSDDTYDRLFGQNDSKELRVINFALHSCKEAMEMSKVQNTVEPERLGVSIATSLGCIDSIDEYLSNNYENGFSDKSCYLNTCTRITERIAEKYGARGPAFTVSTACAAGTNSIGIALDAIRNERADVMICGGADPISRISINGFNSLKSLSASGLVRAFSKNREGLIIGEGAGIIILEEYEHAIARGADILCEVAGYAISNDAYHMTTPDPKGGGAIRAMLNCIEDANASIEEVDYINAHGTGTMYNDVMELSAIYHIFKERAKDIPISSIKGMVGHMLGTAGSIEFIATVLAISDNFLPPTINFDEPIDGYGEHNFVPNTYQEKQVNCAISNSFAFAGNTASIMVRRGS